jgi:hypothetical protein
MQRNTHVFQFPHLGFYIVIKPRKQLIQTIQAMLKCGRPHLNYPGACRLDLCGTGSSGHWRGSSLRENACGCPPHKLLLFSLNYIHVTIMADRLCEMNLTKIISGISNGLIFTKAINPTIYGRQEENGCTCRKYGFF